MRILVTFALLGWLLVTPARSDDFQEATLQNWHQWRGPNADGMAPLGDPPVEWSETKNVRHALCTALVDLREKPTPSTR